MSFRSRLDEWVRGLVEGHRPELEQLVDQALAG